MPELLDISLQLNSCREVAMRSHVTMARGEFLWKSCQRGEGDCEGSLGAGKGVEEGLVSVSGDGVLQACGFVAISQEPWKGDSYRVSLQ